MQAIEKSQKGAVIINQALSCPTFVRRLVDHGFKIRSKRFEIQMPS